MAKLVDADKLIKSAPTELGVPIWQIEDAPIVDAVEVVRCKDCKYNLNSSEKCGLVDTRLHFYETDKVWTEDSYCSWGERREDG